MQADLADIVASFNAWQAQRQVNLMRPHEGCRLPPIFKPAKLVGVTAACPVERAVGLSVQLEDGTVLRLRVDVDRLASAGASAVRYAAVIGSQSSNSSDSPSTPGLPQAEGQ